jgi:hypothetical protein
VSGEQLRRRGIQFARRHTRMNSLRHEIQGQPDHLCDLPQAFKIGCGFYRHRILFESDEAA